MIVEFLSQANSELIDAVAYYEGELNGLGLRFWEEVDQHISWIARNHEVPRLRPGGAGPEASRISRQITHTDFVTSMRLSAKVILTLHR
jgi:hypothetical protein